MERARLDALLDSGRLRLPDGPRVDVRGGDPVIAAKFPISEIAAAALALCGANADRLWSRGGASQGVRVDVRAAAASLLSFMYLRVDGEPRVRTSATNPCVALYECRDGRWVHLHGAHPHLREGTLDVLGASFDANSIAAAVRRFDAQALEDALAERGMCGAMVRTADEWRDHPQAAAIRDLPAVEVLPLGRGPVEPPASGTSPLAGVRVLDLTRVLAGPTCGRTLAQHGADVLHISAAHLPTEETFDIDTGHGKRSAQLNLDLESDRERLRTLVRECDVFVNGYRAGALARRGFGVSDLEEMRPGIIVASINCYGHEGPWVGRPGWEQLAQTVSGIAAAEGAPGPPRLVPAAACDYTTGYLAAAGVMQAIAQRATVGGGWHVRASLTQTAMWIERQSEVCDRSSASGVGDPSDLMEESDTPFGRVSHLRPALQLPACAPEWRLPTVPHGYHEAAWLPR
jgi:crotonobetainyl-CoA:carnitine CoA-transferase CaiB-like acyl-CoA transferase